MKYLMISLPLTLLLSVGLVRSMEEKRSLTMPTPIDTIDNPLAQTIYLANQLKTNNHTTQTLKQEIEAKNKILESADATRIALITALKDKLEGKKTAEVELSRLIEENKQAYETKNTQQTKQLDELRNEIKNIETQIETPSIPSRSWFGWFRSGK